MVTGESSLPNPRRTYLFLPPWNLLTAVLERTRLVCAPPRLFEARCLEAEAEGWRKTRAVYRSREMCCRIFTKPEQGATAMSQSQSSFDPEAFLNAQQQGANATQFKPCPAGEYPAVADDVKPREWVSQEKGTSGVALDVFWSIDSDAVRNELGREKVIVVQGIFLDLTPSGALDMGENKNVRLGQLREAVGLNDPNQPFSFGMIRGKAAKVKVEHEIYKNAPMAKVTGAVRL